MMVYGCRWRRISSIHYFDNRIDTLKIKSAIETLWRENMEMDKD